MGVVWKARQLSLDRMVAIKVVRSEAIRSPDDVAQILHEARAAAKLKHQGIVQVYDSCEQNGTYFLVMEYVDGYTIGQWLARRKQLAAKDVLLIAESVAAALKYAWQAAELTHCDIKPANVMVDKDGTIKVADLGLSLTKDRRANCNEDEVTGTPGYMSPEQVRGEVALDCRADIYSLGAMMYELLTGCRPFSDKSDKEAMECQLTEQICDPRDLVPTIPLNVCLLLERMLVKDRDGRLPDWDHVLGDIRRVMKGALPAGAGSAGGASTLLLRKVPNPEPVSTEVAAAPGRGGGRVMWALFLVFLLVAGYAGYRLWSPAPAPVEEPAVPQAVESPAGGNELARQEESAQRLKMARQWDKDHPAKYESAIRRYRSLIELYPGTAAARMALEDIEQIYLRRERDRLQAFETIKRKTEELVQANDINGALAFVEQYAGAFAAETESNRLSMASGLRQRLANQAAQRVDGEVWRGFVDRIAGVVFAGKLQAALDDVAAEGKSGRFEGRGEDLASLLALLKEAQAYSSSVLESFRGEIGKVVPIQLGRGEMRVCITGINGQKVSATMIDTAAQISFDPETLPLEERLRRMGVPGTPGAALAKGIVAVGGRQFQTAEDLFQKTGPLLSELLVAKLQDAKSARTEDELVVCLARILKAGGIAVGPFDESAWVKAVDQARLTREQAAMLNEHREKFLAGYGTTDFGVKSAPVLLALERQCALVMEGKAVAAPVVEVPAATEPVKGESDISSVMNNFMEQNPGVEQANMSVQLMNGGTGLKVVSDSVVTVKALAGGSGIKGVWIETMRTQNVALDLQPLTKMGLKDLRLKGYVPQDMNVLRGMPLRQLVLNGVNAASFAALEGLPLTDLDLTGSSIRDLNPLYGMKLERLTLSGTKVGSLMSLAGMPLRTLICRGIPVRDVGALRGLPLEILDLSETPLVDLNVLRGMELRSLSISKTAVRDIGFCAQMPLETLDISDTPVVDITGLRGKNMKRLILARSGVRDIGVLAGCSIDILDLSGTKIPPVSLAQAVPKIRFMDLALDNLDLTRIDFLKGKRVRRLSLAGTKVVDMSPLADMNIRMLNVKGVRIEDVRELRNLKDLEDLWCDLDPMQVQVLLRGMPNLTRVNGVNQRNNPP